MTNKEAIKILRPLFEQCKGTNRCIGYIEHYFTKHEEMALDLAIKALEERPQGEWIEDSYVGFRCSECAHVAVEYTVITKFPDGSKVKGGDYNLTPYCPNCGADMRGEEE